MHAEWVVGDDATRVVADVDLTTELQTVRVAGRIVSRMPREKCAGGHRFALGGREAHATLASTPIGRVWRLDVDGKEMTQVTPEIASVEFVPIAPETHSGRIGELMTFLRPAMGLFGALFLGGTLYLYCNAQKADVRKLSVAPHAGEDCRDDRPVACSMSDLLACDHDTLEYAVRESCTAGCWDDGHGAAKCGAAASVGDACTVKGASACAPDGHAMVTCTDGTFVRQSVCAAGCVATPPPGATCAREAPRVLSLPVPADSGRIFQGYTPEPAASAAASGGWGE